MKNRSLDEIHSEGKYISNQGIIFSEESKQGYYKEFVLHLSNEKHLDETIDWLNSITEHKWNKLYESLKTLENEHKKNLEIITNLLGVDKCIDGSRALEAITYLQQSLNSIGFMLMGGAAIAKHMKTIVAKENRAKQNRTDPNKQKAIDEAMRIWRNSPNYSLDEVAERIRNAKITDKSHSTIKQWISGYNPTKRKKK